MKKLTMGILAILLTIFVFSASPKTAEARHSLGMGMVTVRSGDRGPHVFELQTELNKRGSSIAVDGIFGAATYKAVVNWQTKTFGWSQADGIVGKDTWSSLGYLMNSHIVYVSTVRFGSSGASVKELQYALNQFFFKFYADFVLEEDGIFGEKTKEFLLYFQREYSYGLTPDGVAGPQTWKVLGQSIGANYLYR